MRFDVKSWLENRRNESTLLGICPVSEEIVEATFQEAHRSKFVPMFVATPRQVDVNGGYTGWSQRELARYLQSVAEGVGYDGPHVLARDHGGPYQSSRDRNRSDLKLDEAMDHAKNMFMRDLKAGFDILHIDATEDPRIDGVLDPEETVSRTTELISYIEKARERENLPEVYYEVGTEEITGGMTEPRDFENFIQILVHQLEELGFERAVERLLFVVGQVGTTMRIDMINKFDQKQAKKLVDISSQHGLFLKVHYTDWLENSRLDLFPKLGVGAANVGPEFAAFMVETLGKLEEQENHALADKGKQKKSSEIMEKIERLTIKEAPWKKFAPDGLKNQELRKFSQEHRREIALCVGRYIVNRSEITEAKQKLYKNLEKYGSIENPRQLVVSNIKESIHRYVKAFNLKNER